MKLIKEYKYNICYLEIPITFLKLLINMNCVELDQFYIHTYHSLFTSEGVAEVSQIFLRDTQVLPKLVSYEFMRNTAHVKGGKPISV
jgi:hypothetical protein